MKDELIKLLSEFLAECDREYRQRVATCNAYNEKVEYIPGQQNNLMHASSVDDTLHGFLKWLQELP